jgi:hypothetical protein
MEVREEGGVRVDFWVGPDQWGVKVVLTVGKIPMISDQRFQNGCRDFLVSWNWSMDRENYPIGVGYHNTKENR